MTTALETELAKAVALVVDRYREFVKDPELRAELRILMCELRAAAKALHGASNILARRGLFLFHHKILQLPGTLTSETDGWIVSIERRAREGAGFYEDFASAIAILLDPLDERLEFSAKRDQVKAKVQARAIKALSKLKGSARAKAEARLSAKAKAKTEADEKAKNAKMPKSKGAISSTAGPDKISKTVYVNATIELIELYERTTRRTIPYPENSKDKPKRGGKKPKENSTGRRPRVRREIEQSNQHSTLFIGRALKEIDPKINLGRTITLIRQALDTMARMPSLKFFEPPTEQNPAKDAFIATLK